MMEETRIIQMNIDRYRAMLNQSLDDETRARVEQLLDQTRCQLVSAIYLQDPRPDQGRVGCPEAPA